MRPLCRFRRSNVTAFFQRARRILSRARFRVLLLGLAAIALTSGCSPIEPPADITIINGVEPESLDPAIITGQADGRVVMGLFEGLTRLNEKTARPEPAMAEKWEISPDGRTYTFHLRTNLLWSTGEPITTADVVYAWIRALDPLTASEYAGQLFYLKNGEAFTTGKIKDPAQVGVHALDPYTLRVELEHPTPFFLDLCAFETLTVVPRKTIEKYGDRWLMAQPLPCSGPYRLGYWHLNDKIRLIKNTNYWDAANTQSGIIDMLPVGSPDAALNLYIHGQADIVWDKSLVPTDLIDLLLRRPDFHSFSYLGTYFIRFNVTKKPFDDARVRRAMGLVLDRERLVTKITRAGEQPAYQLVPPGTANYLPLNVTNHDLVLARKLMAEAGFPDGKGFPTFEYLFDAPAGGSAKIHEDIAVEMQQMWHDDLGIQMGMRQLEWKVYLSAQAHLDYQVMRSSWIGDYNDPNTFLSMFTTTDGNNHTGWSNAKYDQLIVRANQEPDAHRRAEIFKEAEKMLIDEDAPIIPLFYYVGINYFDTNRIQGIYQNVLDMHPLQTIKKIKPPR
jgi:oligopeptide transport system substrate-binding protein